MIDETVATVPSRALPVTLADLAVPGTVVAHDTTCEVVDRLLAVRPDLPAVVVRGHLDVDPAGTGADSRLGEGRGWGLLEREKFYRHMAGNYGYGRALLGRRPVAEIADWSPLMLPVHTRIEDAATAITRRGWVGEYEQILVADDAGTIDMVAVAALFEALATSFADQALRDSLTGLGNREAFLQSLTAACARAGENDRVAVVFVDLDRFKQVNDTFGHQVGDALLEAVAGRLRAAARPTDFLARLGGDEFVVILELPGPPTGSEDMEGDLFLTAVHGVADRLVDVLRQPLKIAGVRLTIGVSVGAAVSVTGGGKPDALLREADLAMYRAKVAGGSRPDVVYDVDDGHRGPLGSLGVDDTLERALRDAEFRVLYQPIVDIGTGRLVSVEALVRWQHPERGLLGPAEFLPAAEANGLIVQLGEWVLTQACTQVRCWDEILGPEAPEFVNVNLSLREMLDEDVVSRVRRVLARTGLEPSRLRLELPEAATVEDLMVAAPPLQKLRELGVALTLDDLGSGASSLRHLTSEELSGIKIDKAFVDGMLHDPRDLAVVRLLIELAHALGVLVTAEGVETDEQLTTLRELGCNLAQGFLIGHPMVATGVESWLTTGAEMELGTVRSSP